MSHGSNSSDWCRNKIRFLCKEDIQSITHASQTKLSDITFPVSGIHFNYTVPVLYSPILFE